MDRRPAAIAELEERLGHVFADRELLEQALTHASVGSGSRKVLHNERLEFLGDRVLGSWPPRRWWNGVRIGAKAS